jgi:predicted nucleic acid-binding protein
MRLYLDASAIICSVEGARELCAAALEWIQRAEDDGQLVTSQPSRLECRVKPLRENDEVLLARFNSLFASAGLYLRDVDAEIIDRATHIRARQRRAGLLPGATPVAPAK